MADKSGYTEFGHDEFGNEPMPVDSSDLLAMGLRAPRCNGCEFARLKHKLGDKILVLQGDKVFPSSWLNISDSWVNVYELDADPVPGQGEPYEYGGRPIQFHAGFMSVGHSNECHHWKPPRGEIGGAR